MNMRLTLALLFIVGSASSQDLQLEYHQGTGRFQKVIELPGKSISELYAIADRWVNLTYKNPDKVIKARLENEMIRGEGIEPNVKLVSLAYADLKYEFTIDIKEGKIRLTITNMVVMPTSGGSYKFETYVYKNDGTERTNAQATNLKDGSTQLANNLYKSLYNSLTTVAKDDW